MRVIPVFAAVLLVTGCGGEGEVYDRSLSEARTILSSTDVPLELYSDPAVDFSVDTTAPDAIRWNVTMRGSTILKYTASLQPEGDHRTRVTMRIDAPSQEAAKRLEEYPKVREFYLAIMKEATDASMEGREFDLTQTYRPMISATMELSSKGKLFPSDGKAESNAP